MYHDCDGPWIYDLLIYFIKMYEDNNHQIPLTEINIFVDKYYAQFSENIRARIKIQLFAFQHEIFNKQYFNVFDFNIDIYDNQYVLYKHNEHTSFGDAGEIWVRPYNYALSIPLTNFTHLYETSTDYVNDPYDFLQCNYNVNYANMLKEISNNALKFGIFKNTIWILGYTNYLLIDNSLIDTGKKYLKLMVGQFTKDKNLNSLNIDITTIKFIGISSNEDFLEYFDEFVGMYVNYYKNTLEFIIHDKQKQLSTLKLPIPQTTNIYFNIVEYPLTFNNYVKRTPIEFLGNFPALTLNSELYLTNLSQFKYDKKPNNIYYNIRTNNFR